MRINNMPQDGYNLLARILEHGMGNYIISFVISIWAGAVRHCLNVLGGAKHSWKTLLIEMFVSAFIGVLVMAICQWREVDVLLSAVYVAICANLGSQTLTILRRKFLKNFGEVDVKPTVK